MDLNQFTELVYMNGSDALSNLTDENYTSSEIQAQQDLSAFELRIAYLIGITFGITIIVGIIGNSLVFLTIMFQKQMRSTTNILILNLAIAELLFIFICVPSTGLNYVLR
jgi:allatostatin receptor